MAGGFTEEALIKKLTELNNSSQSIQTLSLWLIHHRKHYSTVVKIWFREIIKAEDSKKLTFMYLANDVIQNSKKKGPEYGQQFNLFLKKAFENMSQCDEHTKNSLDRLLTIWNDRGVYDSVTLAEFQRALVLGYQPPHKKSKTSNKTNDKKKSPNKVRNKFDTERVVEYSDGSIETFIHLSPRSPGGDPPEPDELINAIQNLELNIASSDEVVRERIAKLPREVSEVSLLSKIQDKEAADKLSTQVGEAVHLLGTYNFRLTLEMEHRKKVSMMLRDYLNLQEELLAQAERTLEEYQEKLLTVFNVRTELQNHIRNLPDLTQLPNVTHGLAPLPSAEHLFMQ